MPASQGQSREAVGGQHQRQLNPGITCAGIGGSDGQGRAAQQRIAGVQEGPAAAAGEIAARSRRALDRHALRIGMGEQFGGDGVFFAVVDGWCGGSLGRIQGC